MTLVMRPMLRNLALTTHVITTVGWLGAVAAFLALAVAVVASPDVAVVRASHVAMRLVGWYVIVPLCVASLATGLTMSLGTPWGLFRHYWVLGKLALSLLSAAILLLYTQALDALAEAAADPAATLDTLRNPSPLLHSAGGLVALVVTTLLSVLKPRGLTAYGARKLDESP